MADIKIHYDCGHAFHHDFTLQKHKRAGTKTFGISVHINDDFKKCPKCLTFEEWKKQRVNGGKDGS